MLLKNEPLENRQVLLTIRVDKEDWQRALQELYNDCSSLYPVEGCAPGKATREQLEAALRQGFPVSGRREPHVPGGTRRGRRRGEPCRSRPRRI